MLCFASCSDNKPALLQFIVHHIIDGLHCTAFAQLDKSPESKGWSEKVQPTPVMGWSKEILQS